MDGCSGRSGLQARLEDEGGAPVTSVDDADFGRAGCLRLTELDQYWQFARLAKRAEFEGVASQQGGGPIILQDVHERV